MQKKVETRVNKDRVQVICRKRLKPGSIKTGYRLYAEKG